MRQIDEHQTPSIINVLLGRHGYGMSPELETDWCRVCLLAGALVGFFIGVSL